MPRAAVPLQRERGTDVRGNMLNGKEIQILSASNTDTHRRDPNRVVGQDGCTGRRTFEQQQPYSSIHNTDERVRCEAGWARERPCASRGRWAGVNGSIHGCHHGRRGASTSSRTGWTSGNKGNGRERESRYDGGVCCEKPSDMAIDTLRYSGKSKGSRTHAHAHTHKTFCVSLNWVGFRTHGEGMEKKVFIIRLDPQATDKRGERERDVGGRGLCRYVASLHRLLSSFSSSCLSSQPMYAISHGKKTEVDGQVDGRKRARKKKWYSSSKAVHVWGEEKEDDDADVLTKTWNEKKGQSKRREQDGMGTEEKKKRETYRSRVMAEARKNRTEQRAENSFLQ